MRLSSFLHTYTLTQLGHMSESGSAHTSEREKNYWRSYFLSLGFTTAIGAHSISKEVAVFSPLWFPKGIFFVSLVSCVLLVFYCFACYSFS